MATISKTIKVTTSVTIEYDPESESVKRAVADYRDVIASNATISSVIRQVAFSRANGQSDDLIEGIGYVKENGIYPSAADADDPILKIDIAIVEVDVDTEEE